MKTLKKIIALAVAAFSLCLTTATGQENYDSNDPNVRVEYKKYESFDLGNLEIEGKIIAPGDLSVQQRDRRKFNRNLFERFDFDPEIKEDIFHLR
jgi:hypothetical protein